MSALEVAVQALVSDAILNGMVSGRVHAIEAPQDSVLPHVVVHLIAEEEPTLLAGGSAFAEARVSIECRGSSAFACNALAEAVKDAYRDVAGHRVSSCDAWIRKEGTDVSEYSDRASTFMRILDFYINWRKAA